MNVLADLLRRITRGSTFVAGIFLLVGMLLLMSNVLGRFLQIVIPGSYELFELIMAIPVAFALVYTALQKAHVIVNLIVSRFPPRLAIASEILAYLISFAIWALIAYAGARLAYENGLREISDILDIPFLPFRIIWIFSLILFCTIYLLDIFGSFRRFLDK